MFGPKTQAELFAEIDRIDPARYARTRNFFSGAVTRLSPYISRGVISVKMVAERLMAKGHDPGTMEKLLQELAWREYFQRVQQHRPGLHASALRPRSSSEPVRTGMPTALLTTATGIDVIDRAVEELMTTGYLHNHARMYLASVACNIGRCDWELPAKWMYFHLLDGDVASNFCSWQWVAGTFSSKRYLANQENMNRYSGTQQQGSFLDVDYGSLEHGPLPKVLEPTAQPDLPCLVEPGPVPQLDPQLPTLVYNAYNLDPEWHAGAAANRILLLEPAHYRAFPVSAKVLDFIRAQASLIPGLKEFRGEFRDLQVACNGGPIHFKEHPLHVYQGHQEPRDWLFPEVTDLHPSFSAYWKRCTPSLKRLGRQAHSNP